MKVMSGNHDGRSVVWHKFSSPMYGRYIRVYPVANNNTICMRMELYGCSNPPSALTTTPASTTQSAANRTTPENVPATTGNHSTSNHSTSTEKLMINSTIAPSALRTKLSSTTLRVANDETPETVSPTSSTEKPISHSATDQPVGSDTTMIIVIIVVVIVVVIAVVIIGFKLWSCHRKRERSEMKSEEEVVELL
ncbi:low-density lipoprotein receptor-related protein 8-like isoform X2 [Acropora muricata]|uniref:low-density lipoprotein receptor-related protein 8-like isoform X2 n=1 Tax=Acropora muricata TaxID=159855 RepID=UPI0034E5376C